MNKILKAKDVEFKEIKGTNQVKLMHKNCGELKTYSLTSNRCEKCGDIFVMFDKNW